MINLRVQLCFLEQKILTLLTIRTKDGVYLWLILVVGRLISIVLPFVEFALMFNFQMLQEIRRCFQCITN